MRLRFVLLTIICLGLAIITSAQSSPTPNYDATATAIVIGATRTAQASVQESPVFETPAEYQLTATALVADVTATAIAAGVNTATPDESLIIVGDDDFALTATAIVAEATAQAGGTTPVDEGSVLPITLLLLVAVIGSLVVLAGIFVFLSRREAGKASS